MTLDTRVAELEAKLTLAEDLIDTLSRTVFRQQQQLDLLQDQLRLLNRRIQDSQPDEARNLRDEIPPHY